MNPEEIQKLKEKYKVTSFSESLSQESPAEKLAFLKGTQTSTDMLESNLAIETIKGLPKAATQVLLDPAAKFIGSAVRAPIDVARGLAGKSPLSSEFNLPSGAKTGSIQSEFGNKANQVIEGDRSLLGATAGTIGETVLGGADVLGAGAIFKKGVPAITNLAKNVVVKQAEKRSLQSTEKAFQEAIDVTAPKITDKIEQAALSQGRIKEGGLLTKTKITPSVQDQRIAESVQGIVKKSVKPQENINAIRTEVARINSDVGEFIANNKSPFNERQLRSKLSSVKEKNKLIFASDPNIEKVVDAVIDEFVKHTKSLDTKGLFEARQSFDKIPAIKRLIESDRLGENVKREVVLGVRRAANEYVSDLLPINNPYKALLKQETNMLRAVENIVEKSSGRAGKKGVQVFLEKHPTIKKLFPWLLGGVATSAIID